MTNKGRSVLNKCERNNIPYFVLSARDEHSMAALLKYLESIQTGGMFGNFGCTPEYIKDVEDILKQFTDWRFKNYTKSPD
jgi:hypothetical protein